MGEVVKTRVVPATQAAVWAVLADFGGIGAWAPNVDHASLMSEQDSGVGMVRRIQAGRTTLLERVTIWDPPARLAYSLEGLPPVVTSVSNEWSLEPAPGGTRVTLTSRIVAGPRFFHRPIAAIIARKLGQASEQMLGGLAIRLAAQHTASQASV